MVDCWLIVCGDWSGSGLVDASRNTTSQRRLVQVFDCGFSFLVAGDSSWPVGLSKSHFESSALVDCWLILSVVIRATPVWLVSRNTSSSASSGGLLVTIYNFGSQLILAVRLVETRPVSERVLVVSMCGDSSCFGHSDISVRLSPINHLSVTIIVLLC